ncbi:XrtA/PEP-CTERM system TPR-repeat protein PrsT [Rhodoferax sp.]|uniref:XrtA/PEP-CTERM system TPR-repeat protein PrsT n=1 Tax=Rhodoferax sp. TaxID=50421 RepID=UPI00374D0D90
MLSKNIFTRSTLSILIVAGLLTACGEEKPEVLIASAKESLAKNDPKTAVIQIKNALQANPNLPEARFLLGNALLASGDLAAAEIEYEKARSLKYSDDLVVPQLAKALLMQGKFKKVTDEMSGVELSLPAAKANLQVALSNSYSIQGMAEPAQKALNAALAAEPSNIDAQMILVRQLAGKNDYPGSLALVNKLVSGAPKNPELLKLKGDIVLYGGNNLEDALEQYKKSVEVKPDYVQGHIGVVTLLLQQDKLEAAQKQLEILKKLAPNIPQTRYFDVQLAYQKKDFKAARDLSQQLVKLVPDGPKVLQLAGAIEFQLNSFVQAEIYLNKALTAAPNYPLARRLLTLTYLRTGQSAKALTTLSPALAQEPIDTSLYSIAGEVYLQNGDIKKASDFFSKALKLDPKDGRKRTSLALAHMMGGDTDAAFTELQDIASSDTGTTADLALVSAYLRKKEFDSALKTVDGIEKKQPKDPLAANLRGNIQISQKNFAGARKSFESALALNPDYFSATASLATLDIFEKKFDDAKKRFEQVLAKNPKNSQAFIGLAELKIRTGGSNDEIAELLGKAVSANPSDMVPRVLLVDQFIKSKDYKQAFSTAQNAVAAFPDSPELLDALGRAQQVTGDTNQALATYNKLADIQPSSPLPFIRMADINVVSKNKEAAVKNLTKALELQPNLLEAQKGLVFLNIALEHYSNAINVTHVMQKQRPKDAIGYMLEGDVNAAQKKWDAALPAYRLALKQGSSLEPAIKIHAALIGSGNKAEADKFSVSWLKDNPKDTGYMMYMADAALAKKDFATAENLYTTVVQIKPDSAIAYNNMAWISGQLKKDSAIGYAEKANALAPDQAPFMDTLAMLLADKGDYAKALEWQNKAIVLQPQNPVFKLNIAKIYLKSGDKAKAKPFLEDLTKLGDKFGDHAEVEAALKGI